MKNRTFVFLIILFFISSCQEEMKKNKVSGISGDINLNNNLRNVINEVDKITLKSENNIIKDLIFFDLDNYAYSLKELVGDNLKIVFRFSDKHCSSCIEHTLKYLKKIENKIGIDNIIIMGDFKNRHSHSIFVRLNSGILQKVYNYNENLKLPVDSLSLPYIFTINNSLRTKNVFVPLKEVPKRTSNSFSELESKI